LTLYSLTHFLSRMTQFLPDNLLALFAPRPSIEYKAPVDELPVDRKRAPINGIAQYIGLFEVTFTQFSLTISLIFRIPKILRRSRTSRPVKRRSVANARRRKNCWPTKSSRVLQHGRLPTIREQPLIRTRHCL
jgi:hypothetical protein